MCGITAAFGDLENKEKFVTDSLNKIVHRGTNVLEYVVLEKAALGANRLPIVDREHGKQPLTNENGTIFAIQNGEIFNHNSLREMLEKKGHIFKTSCDTEVLVHLYEEFGEKLIEHIDSEMFAFIIYDNNTKKFFVARDRFGLKPLYYTIENGVFYFASELKQLAQFAFIKNVKIFPKGHYMNNGSIKRYYALNYSNTVKNEEYARTTLTKLIVDSVKKRVDTDLPIAVLLSGGVDSSLIMEIATRFHSDVTAFILGSPGSSDYEAAVKLCKDHNYKYQIVYPNVDYEKEFKKLIYHLELYEAQVIRQSFALDILAKEVVRAGFRIALVGEASDELFGGYNEFSRLKSEHINKGCYLITNDLERSHNVRVDRMSMKHTLETRAPFFDTQLVEFAMKIEGKLKIKKENHNITTKYILRKVAEQFLPDYITWRYKVPFANGAGMNVGFNFRSQDGDVAKKILERNNAKLDDEVREKYGFLTDEEAIYFEVYQKFNFDKLENNWKRIITKETLSSLDEEKDKIRLLVAEFGRLPLYFPIYLAARINIFHKHNLDVSFITSGGDDLTYNSLLSGSAQIGIADPIFTFSDSVATKGKIVGQLVGKVPLVAVSLDPKIQINTTEDLRKYKIGTFQEYSTTNTLIKELLPEKELISIKYSEITQALKDRRIDVGIMTPDIGYDLVAKGGHILYFFEDLFGDYLFTGITICDNIDQKFSMSIKSFLSSIKESINYIKKNKSEALKHFKKEFPELLNHDVMFDYLINFWNKKLLISDSGMKRAKHSWQKVYPWLLKANMPQFIKPRPEDDILNVINHRNVSRDIPYLEDKMAMLISGAIEKNQPIQLVGFWGASNKRDINSKDFDAIEKFKNMSLKIRELHKKGIELTFILADEHARLNHYEKSNYTRYLNKIKKVLLSHRFKVILLSELWKKYKLSDEFILKKHEKISDAEWTDLINHAELEKSARNRGFKNYKAEAKRYYVCRKLESGILIKEYPNMIFHTYSEDIHQNLFPDCPTIYLWVTERGYTISPWFDKYE